MAPIEKGDGSSFFEGWEKWQIALAVGAPVCLGLAGIWFYNRSKQSGDQKEKVPKSKPGVKDKVKPPASDGNVASGSTGKPKESSPLVAAQEFKNSGNKCFKQGKYDEAIKFYTQALEICPPEHKTEISTFYANRAAAYEKLKNLRQVLENCTEAIRLNGKYTKALLRRATAAEQLGELQLSLEDVTAVCILEGFQNQATLQTADRVLKNLGKMMAKQAMKNKKASMPSRHSIKSYFASYTQDPIQTCFKEAPTTEEKQLNIPVGETTISQRTEADKDDLPESETQKISNVSEDNVQADDTPQSTEREPPLVNGEPSENSVFKKAVDKLEKGQYDNLISLCTQEVALEPVSHYQPLALLLRGTMFYLTAQSDKAQEDFETILKEDNLNKKIKVNALIKRGSLLINKEQHEKGLEDFALATKIDPDNSDIYHHRGHQNIQIDRLEEAVRDFENSILKNPDFPNSYIQKSYAEHRRAAAEQSTSKLEKAIKSYEATLKRFPNNADGHALYAQALCDLGRFDDADNEFETAVKLEPDNANTLVQRALLKLQWKQSIEEPVTLIKQAIVLDDKCEYAYEMLGTIEVQRGDMVKAVGLFETAIELCRTEAEMSHLFSLLHAAKAQLKATQTIGIPLPSNFSPM